MKIEWIAKVEASRESAGIDDLSRIHVKVAGLAVSQLILDVKAFVNEKVLASIESLHEGAVVRDDQACIRHQACRRSALRAWTKCRTGELGWEVLRHLLAALNATPESEMTSLNAVEQMSVKALATKLYEMGRVGGSSKVEAPLFSEGSCAPVLRAVVSHLEKNVGSRTNQETVVAIIVCALQRRDVRYLPWSPPRTGARGRPHVAPTLEHWAMINKPAATVASRPVASSSRTPATVEQRINDVVRRTVLSDPTRAWYINDLPLRDAGHILGLSRLPEDFTPPPKAMVPSRELPSIRRPVRRELPANANVYFRNTFLWVAENFDYRNRLHVLALVVAFIATHTVPRIFTTEKGSDVASQIERLKSPDMTLFRRRLFDLPWVVQSGKKGVTDRRPFWCMIATWIIAHYEPESPLRQFANSNAGSLGHSWTEPFREI